MARRRPIDDATCSCHKKLLKKTFVRLQLRREQELQQQKLWRDFQEQKKELEHQHKMQIESKLQVSCLVLSSCLRTFGNSRNLLSMFVSLLKFMKTLSEKPTVVSRVLSNQYKLLTLILST